MRLLLIHTAGGDGSVALADTEREPMVVAAETMPGRTASERLVPVVRGLLGQVGWKLGELDAIGVVHGPGSFTGVRVGVAAAKGFSDAAGVPVVAISRLRLVAEVAGADCVALDAGRGEFYVGEYAAGRCVREALLDESALRELVRGRLVAVAEKKVFDARGDMGAAEVKEVAEPAAADMLALVKARVDAGELDDAALLDANYLRRTDLEIFAKAAVAR